MARGGLAAGLAVLVLCSCASYSTRLEALRDRAGGGDLGAALELVEDQGNPGELLYHLERGTLLRLLERYGESNTELERAEQLRDELYTRSLSRRGLTFLVNDEIEAYAGEEHEGSYLHLYRILNFLAVGEGAACEVEARRLALRLTELRDRADLEPWRREDPFLAYVTGVVFEARGQWNDALIAYRLARDGYREWETAFGVAPPPWIPDDIARTARRSGIDLREIEISPAGRAPVSGDAGEDAGAAGNTDAGADEMGELVVLFERGWAPKRVSEHLRVPVLGGEDPEGDGDAALAAGLMMAGRYQRYRAEGAWSEGPMEVDYFLDVAIPVLTRDTGSQVTDGRITLRAAGAETGATPIERRTHRAADLEGLVSRGFAEREVSVLAKTFARALIKYAAHRKAEKELGFLAGLLANIVGAATEKADTRSWLLLPAEIQIGRVALLLGEYELELEACDLHGRGLEARGGRLRVDPGEIEVVSWRSFH